nr:unnamed protein product [Digitaria exilis]
MELLDFFLGILHEQWRLVTATLLVAFALPLLSIHLSRSRKQSRCSSPALHLPPGPRKLPFLGNLHQIGPLPHRSLRELARQYGPVMLLRLGSVPTVVVSSPEAAREVMSTHDARCCSRPSMPGPRRLTYEYKDVAFAPYGDHFRERRKLLILELLSMRRVQAAWDAREAQDTFIGGINTSAVTMVWAMSEMIRHPTVLKSVQDEIRAVVGNKQRVSRDDVAKFRRLKMVVKETLRLHPPLTLLLPRETIQQVNIIGYDVPANTRIIGNAWAISRDPSIWKDPEVFNPERFKGSKTDFNGTHFEFTPFGSGHRICPGMAMAVANIEFTLANLLCCFDWELPHGVRKEDISMQEAGSLAFQKKMPLVLVPRRVQ